MQLDSLFKPESLKAALAELVGTFFLTLAALISGTPYAVGLVLAACVYAIGDVSGCHINPAVTIGLLIDKHIPISKGVIYIIAQIVGALLASLVGGIAGKLAPSNYHSADAILEFFGFGILMLTVVAVYEKNVPKSGSGVAIGAALTAGLLTTGGILNPAVAIAMKQTNSPGTWAPILSAILFASLFKFFFHTEPLIGDKATKLAILPQLPKARIIHFATHGLYDEVTGGRVPGAIALAPSGGDNGLLTASEILKLKLNAELVVLSACNTGQGNITGEGVIGLSRSLISAGVPSVIVSLWSVPDAPTGELMKEFYTNLGKNPDKATALRSAMLATISKHPEPRDWAAFTLIGEAH